MGEIGISRREFLYDMRWWEIRSTLRGYNRRYRHPWSMTRWQTYHLMAAQIGGKELDKAGIHSPTDLIRFTWDTDAADDNSPDDQPTKAQREKLLQLMHEENMRLGAITK